MPKFSMWTIPKDSWEKAIALENIEITTEAKRCVLQAIETTNVERNISDRIRPFETQIDAESLAKTIA